MFQWLQALWARWFAPPAAHISERLYLFPVDARPLLQEVRDTDLLNVLLETQERVKGLCSDVRYEDFIAGPVINAISTGTPPTKEWVDSVSYEQGVPLLAADAVQLLCKAWVVAQEGHTQWALSYCADALDYANMHANRGSQ